MAAASHKVGHECFGGDWHLDHAFGIRTKPFRIECWQGHLSSPVLINGLGGAAGFGENTFARNDDNHTDSIDITSVFGQQGLKFGSSFYMGTYINNNGMITFGEGFQSFTPTGISDGIENSGGGYLPLISLFWTDIDTRFGSVPVTAGGTSTGSNLVYWDIDTNTSDGDGKKITFTWDDVGLYPSGQTSALAGQIILYEAGSGNMDIEFRYEYTGDGYEAAGWNIGTSSTAGGRNGIDYYQISAPGNLSWLATTAGNTGLDGIYRWYLRDGKVSDTAGDVSYSINTFVERQNNDGSISTTISITLVGDTFTGSENDNFSGTKALVTNVPAGLIAEVIRTSATTVELRLTGTATDHANAQDISNLQIAFQNSAFASGSAASISGTSKTFNVDFIDGSNHAPAGLGDLTLNNADEDTVAPAGAAINSLTGLDFTDQDNGDSLSGVAVVGNTANASAEGVWQYSTNAGTNWYGIGSVSGTQALSLSAATFVRFVPLANYNGTPPVLTVRALDSSANYFSITGASETRVTLDASSNGGSSAIAGAANTISTTINPVNDAPTVTSNGATAYTENDAAKAVNAALTVADIDNGTLTSATVTITANFQSGADVLAFTNDSTSMGDIIGSYDATTGVMTLTSENPTATTMEWQAALRAVAYTNSSDAPSTGARTVAFLVNDGHLNSAAGNRTVNVTAVSDGPSIVNLDGDSPNGFVNTEIKIDSGTSATVTDVDSMDFSNGFLTITTASGTANGNFNLDGTNAKAGADSDAANSAIASNETIYVDATEIGTVHTTNNGQAGASFTITFNSNATPSSVAILLRNLINPANQ